MDCRISHAVSCLGQATEKEDIRVSLRQDPPSLTQMSKLSVPSISRRNRIIQMTKDLHTDSTRTAYLRVDQLKI